MKKIILFMAVALLATIANAQEQKEYHKNGQLMNVGATGHCSKFIKIKFFKQTAYNSSFS